MITILDFDNLKLYKNMLYYPIGTDNKNMGTALVLCTNNRDESTKIINDKFVRNKAYYPGYFYENRYNLKIFNKPIKLNLTKEVTNMFVTMRRDKVNFKNIKKYSYNYEQLTGLNTYIDMSKINELFFGLQTKLNATSVRSAKEYLAIINSIYSQLDSLGVYKNKILVIDFDALNINIKDMENFDRMNTPNVFAILFYLLRYDFPTFATFPFNILLRCGRFTIMVKPSECNKDSYKQLMATLMKVRQAGKLEDVVTSPDVMQTIKNNKTADEKQSTDNIVANEIPKEQIFADTVSKAIQADILGDIDNLTSKEKVSYAFTGNPVTDTKDIESTIEKNVEELVKSNQITEKDTPDDINKKVKDKLQQDSNFMSELELVKNNRITNMMSAGNLARNKELAKRQAKIGYKNKTIDSIVNESANKVLKPKQFKANVINKDIVNLKLPNFDRIYNKEIYDRDVISILNSFQNKDIPMYILDMKKEDTSDAFNKKYTWTVTMESADRVRHKLVFDMPKFVNDSFMYLGGNKKNMYKQMFLLPISKTEPNVVQICTNYNKAFIRRLGDKMAPKSERFRKVLPMFPKIKPAMGDNSNSNKVAITTLEFDELAKSFNSIDAKGLSFIFNIPTMFERMDELGIKRPNNDKLLPIGFNSLKGKIEVMYLDVDKDKVQGTSDSLIDFIVEMLSIVEPNFKKEFYSVNVGKKYMYNSVTIMGKHIPLILLLSYVEGLSTVLKKGEIKHYFSDTRPQLKDSERNDKGIIDFKDGYLVYDKYPFGNSLLLNGLNALPTKNFEYSDLDEKQTYLGIFEDLFSMKKIANALDNFYNNLLDPKTIEVLQDFSLPTEFVEVFLYANKLLEDNEYINQINMTSSRIRSNEIVTGILYKTLATAYESYRLTAGNKSPKKMTIPRDQVIKNILMLNTVEDYSALNPVLETEKTRAISFKGHSGMNLDRAYTIENRSYDKSMLGILSLSSPPTGGVGLVRQLPLDSNILSTMGYVKVADSKDELKAPNLFSPAELLVPSSSTKDDAPRIAMTATQSKHVVPCKKYDKLLVGNGTDRVLAEIISDDFAFKAKEDGTVIELDNDNGVMVVKYKNGEHDFIELNSKVLKNGGGGFYIANKLITDLSEGAKFKQGDVLASNPAYFNQNGDGTATFKAGTLTKIALAQGYYSYEDSSMVSSKLCKDMSTEVVMKKQVVLGPNSNVEFIVKKGDKIQVGEPLIIFDTSYNDEGINKMLAGMGDELGKEVSELGKKYIKSKYSGVIEDIKVYYTVDNEQLSPSLRKTISSINKSVVGLKKTISKYKNADETEIVFEPTEKVDTQYGKVKGVTVGEGVYIEFYIKYNDIMKIGDKITFFTALKSVICDVMPEGKESFSEYRPEEEVSAYLAPDSVLKRMVGSVLDNMFENKILIELKRQCKEIYEGKR